MMLDQPQRVTMTPMQADLLTLLETQALAARDRHTLAVSTILAGAGIARAVLAGRDGLDLLFSIPADGE